VTLRPAHAGGLAAQERLVVVTGKPRCPQPFDPLLAQLLGVVLRLLTHCQSPLRAACHGSFDLDLHAHPRMDAALKTMFPFRQIRDVDFAALKDPGLGHRDV
jgi:hypothetical protein